MHFIFKISVMYQTSEKLIQYKGLIRCLRICQQGDCDGLPHKGGEEALLQACEDEALRCRVIAPPHQRGVQLCQQRMLQLDARALLQALKGLHKERKSHIITLLTGPVPHG